jgi:ammonium transporter, Amt family
LGSSDGNTVEEVFRLVDTGNTAWVLASAALVLFMTPGLAFFYGGMVRTKNVLDMLMQSVIAMAIVSVLWAVVAFSLAFGDANGFIGDFTFAGLKDVANETTVLPGYTGALALTIPPVVFCAYQMMFAIITPALITGAIADRMKFSAWMIFLSVWLVVVYAPVAHWVFSPTGWLFERGALDFAGGTVVHINAGIAALACVLVIGKRRGWPREAMLPHSLPLTVLGAGILWFGWFGFNAGSALGATNLAGQAFMNTDLAAAGAAIGWLVVERIKTGHFTTLGAVSGAVAGLVAITPCAGYVSGMSPIAIGAIAGALCYLAISLKFRFGYDDSLDVVAVHLVGGIAGSVLLAFFAEESFGGLFASGDTELLVNQLIAVGSTIGYSFVLSFLIAKVIDATVGLRVSEEDEVVGLDTTQHAETAYNLVESGSVGRLP